jgi:copper chaperone NosL
MKIRKLSAFTILIFSAILAGCRSSDENLPDIRYGEEACVRCRMIINEKRFAAVYRTESGTLKKFDDLGCAVLHLEADKRPVKQFWVHDYEGDAWLDTKAAVFVHSTGISTPMGYGIVTLATHEGAAALAKRVNGQILPFNQLQGVLQQHRFSE